MWPPEPSSAIDLEIAGHEHMAQELSVTEASGRQTELIAGNSGTAVEMENGVFTGADIGDDALARGWRYAEFGFTGLERIDTGWVATLPMADGTVPLTCLITAGSAACVP
jgi:hypothetical protein